jgi:hypothetical protein
MIEITSDPQVVFDTVCEHALRQNKRCVDDSGCCLYRHRGMKCFAGALIPNDRYHIGMENKSWESLAERGIVSYVNITLIKKLQSIHDAEQPEKWVESLRELGKKFELNLDKLPAVE